MHNLQHHSHILDLTFGNKFSERFLFFECVTDCASHSFKQLGQRSGSSNLGPCHSEGGEAAGGKKVRYEE